MKKPATPHEPEEVLIKYEPVPVKPVEKNQKYVEAPVFIMEKF